MFAHFEPEFLGNINCDVYDFFIVVNMICDKECNALMILSIHLENETSLKFWFQKLMSDSWDLT